MNTCPRCGSAASLSSNPLYLCASCYPGMYGSLNSLASLNLSSQLGRLQQQYTQQYTQYGGITSGQLATKPPVVEERAEPVYGWRSYRMTNGGVLMGVRAEWPERNFTATCEITDQVGPPERIREMLNDDVAYRFWLERQRGSGESRCATHLESGTCSCGVYLRAKPERFGRFETPYVVYAKVLAHGVVALDEDGNARASEVQIEALYVVPLEGPDPLFEYVDWERLGNVLRGRYDVPVQVVATLEALTEETVGASIPKARGETA